MLLPDDSQEEELGNKRKSKRRALLPAYLKQYNIDKRATSDIYYVPN